MNIKMVFNTIGKLSVVLSILLLLPAAVSLYYNDGCLLYFLITIAVSSVFGIIFQLLFHTKNRVIYAKEGFAIVVFSWILMSVIGCLPFYLSGQIPSFVDAFFETVSGFTTTGASILKNVELLSRSLLFWRSFTHWIGGMGVLVFVMALVSNITDRSIHIMRAEMPGPIVGKLVPKAKETAKILYLIYIAMTLLEIGLLILGGLSIFESTVYSFGTAGTGGFSLLQSGLANYSPYVQWVITIFMLLFGVNFNLYYLLLIKRFKSAISSSELWCYISIILISVLIITFNVLPIYNGSFAEAIRQSAFQVSSIITTTGYATADYNLWPSLSKGILVTLMFMGGCAGSTAGGLKVSRVMLIFKSFVKELKTMLHPRSVNTIKYEGKTVDSNTVSNVNSYFTIYIFCIFAVFLLLSINGINFETTFTAAVSCFNNVGPGIGIVGPFGGYSEFSAFSKIVLSFAMLFGRLEIFPMILFFMPSTWKRSK